MRHSKNTKYIKRTRTCNYSRMQTRLADKSYLRIFLKTPRQNKFFNSEK